MNRSFICFLLCILSTFFLAAAKDVEKKGLLGYAVNRLKTHTSKLSVSTSTSSSSDCGDQVQQYWFKNAVIDNFAPIETQQFWKGEGQRYWINKELWGGVGYPIFVFIGGEGEESCSRLTNKMYLYDLAVQHQALLVDVEHRFYGESYPTSDMSTESLRYLSSQQALADLARVIGYIKSVQLKSPDSKVVTVGGSYPGNLAAWFRLKYPSVTLGSIASSAPVTATLNFYQYMEVVGNALTYFSGQSCYDAMENAANQVSKLASQGFSSSGMKQLETDFKSCASINNAADLAIFYSNIMGNVQGTVQYNNERNGIMNVTNICATMTAGPDPYTQFVKLQELYLTENGQQCDDVSYNNTITYLSESAKDPSNAARPWTYQTCNEFGYFQTTDSTKQPFHSFSELNLDFSRAICHDSFNGWKRDPEVNWVNQEYGDVHIAGTNILFSSGTIDPWHALGVTNASAPLLPQSTELPVYILGTAHCNDLKAPANSDPESLTFARQYIAQKVAALLA